MEIFLVALAAYQSTAFTRSLVDSKFLYPRWMKPAVTAIFAMVWESVWHAAISPYRYPGWHHIAIYAVGATAVASFIHRLYALLYYLADYVKMQTLRGARRRGY